MSPCFEDNAQNRGACIDFTVSYFTEYCLDVHVSYCKTSYSLQLNDSLYMFTYQYLVKSFVLAHLPIILGVLAQHLEA